MMRYARNLFNFTAIILPVIYLAGNLKAATDPNSQAKVRLQQPAIYFTENKGQWDGHVLFKADGGRGLTWWFERDGLTVAVIVPDTAGIEGQQIEQINQREHDLISLKSAQSAPSAVPSKGHALKLRFVPSDRQSSDIVFASSATAKQSQPATEVIPDGKLSWNNNYFLGNDESKWAPDCGNFTRLTYRNVWDGIDVVYYGEGDQLKYDYVVKPGADPSNVRLRWLGLEEPLALIPAQAGNQNSNSAVIPAKAGIQPDTGLLLATSVGTLREGIPLAYQRDENGARVPVEVSFVILSENEVGLEVVGKWDRTKELVVDPLVYSTYLGGSGWDDIFAIATDNIGNTITAGSTQSQDFPITAGCFDETYNDERDGDNDCFIAKISRDGSSLIYCTYIGGRYSEILFSIIQGQNDRTIFIGGTVSNDFPTTEGAYDRVYANGRWNRDGIIGALNNAGNALIFSTFLGGDEFENTRAIALTDNGDIIVGGLVFGAGFPVSEGVIQPNCSGERDGFIAKISGDGSSLMFGTYYGGSDIDEISALTIDSSEHIVVTGTTRSNDLPIAGESFDESYNGDNDVFVTWLSAEADEIISGTYLGDWGSEEARTITFDGIQGVIVGGTTNSRWFPTTHGSFDETYSDSTDCFLARLTYSRPELIYSTFLGDRGYEQFSGAFLDPDGSIIAAGFTSSQHFPVTQDAYQIDIRGRNDLFIVRLNAEGSNLIYGTHFGGWSDEECLMGIANDNAGGVAMGGFTYGETFPTTENAFDQTFNGGYSDGIAARLDIGLTYILRWIEMPHQVVSDEIHNILFEISGVSSNEDEALTLDFFPNNIPDGRVIFNDFGDGSGSFEWELDYDDAGEYTASFTLSNGEDSISADVVIIVNNVNRPPGLHAPQEETVEEGGELSFSVLGVDSDSNMVCIGILSENLPDGWIFFAFEPDFVTFYWRPTYEDAGVYDILFYGTDNIDTGYVNVRIIVLNVVGINDLKLTIPPTHTLSLPYPNPFNSSTTIRFGLPVSGEAILHVTDTNGRLMATLVEGRLEAGWHEIIWNAEAIPAGVYLVELISGERKILQKVAIAR